MRTAIYARVSVKHSSRKDLSIEAQIAVCRKYLQTVFGTMEEGEENKPAAFTESDKGRENKLSAEKRDKEDIVLFTDLGYSGRTMKRPAFLALQEQICHHKVDCLVVKDFSRIGRDYRQVGGFVEKLLPQYHVRLLSAAEHYDSQKNSNLTAIGLTHLLNEWYARDIGQKVALVKAEQKRKGNYLGSVPPYGWRIVKKGGVRQLEQAESYQVVEKILLLHVRGYSSEEIAAQLTAEQINPPAVYQKTGVLTADKAVQKWESGTIRNLLRRYNAADR